MKIYTKTGDQGTTGLLGGTRVAKHHIRISCYGTIDELNSWLGLIRDQDQTDRYREDLLAIQRTLFTIGALLATDPKSRKGGKKAGVKSAPVLAEKEIRSLEDAIDRMDETLPAMTHFILPGGHPTVSYCHIARTVCRRAERLLSELRQQSPVDQNVFVYVNRLSDYLFVLARRLSADLGADEIKWIPGTNS